MRNTPSQSLKEAFPRLVAVAGGSEPADTVVKNVRLVNVNTGEIVDGMDIAAAHGRIALVGDASHTIGESTEVFDAQGLYAAPGFLDGHVHVECSMMTMREYAKCVVPHGTTAIFPDPHEIANVLGTRGVEFMLDDAKGAPLRVYTCFPSCVPAVSAFEDSGYAISAEETAAFMERGDICALGEMMDFPGVLRGDAGVHSKLISSHSAGKPITGHIASLNERELNGYIAAGIRCCHESVTREEIIAKMRLGMYVQLRESLAWMDVAECIKALTEQRVDTRFATLVSDGCYPTELLSRGNMDFIVRRAISEGLNPVTAIQLATINTASCYGLENELGSLTPGKLADIVLLSDLAQVRVEKVFIGGVLVAEGGRPLMEIGSSVIPDFVTGSVHIDNTFEPSSFKIKAPGGRNGKVTARVIKIIPNSIMTEKALAEMEATDGYVDADTEKDILKISVTDRHRPGGTTQNGFVTGFNLKGGAIATTVSHDAHNLIIIGDNDADMALAGNTIVETGGGIAVVKSGKVTACLPLPLAGLMSPCDAKAIAKSLSDADMAIADLGCRLAAPFNTVSMVSLAVLPSLRITNRGIVDTEAFEFVSLFED